MRAEIMIRENYKRISLWSLLSQWMISTRARIASTKSTTTTSTVVHPKSKWTQPKSPQPSKLFTNRTRISTTPASKKLSKFTTSSCSWFSKTVYRLYRMQITSSRVSSRKATSTKYTGWLLIWISSCPRGPILRFWAGNHWSKCWRIIDSYPS